MRVDPLAEKYPSISPYAYVANNPINAIDPDGREIVWLNWGGNYSKIIRALNRTGTFNTIFTRFIKNQDNVFITPTSGGYMGYAPSTRGANGYNIHVGNNGFLNGGRLTADPTLIAKVIMHEGCIVDTIWQEPKGICLIIPHWKDIIINKVQHQVTKGITKQWQKVIYQLSYKE